MQDTYGFKHMQAFIKYTMAVCKCIKGKIWNYNFSTLENRKVTHDKYSNRAVIERSMVQSPTQDDREKNMTGYLQGSVIKVKSQWQIVWIEVMFRNISQQLFTPLWNPLNDG